MPPKRRESTVEAATLPALAIDRLRPASCLRPRAKAYEGRYLVEQGDIESPCIERKVMQEDRDQGQH
jgi:hypothetical protein